MTKSPKPALVALKPKRIESPAPLDNPAPEAEEAPSEGQNNSAIFRAVGIIAGAVDFDEDGRAQVTIGQRSHKQALVQYWIRVVFGKISRVLIASSNSCDRL